jgi:glucan phosphoethanolaminetransferase (alkaline phosphatase superfamily)
MVVAYALLNGSVIWHDLAKLAEARPIAAGTYLLLYAVSGVSLGVLLMSLNRYLATAVFLLLLIIVTTNHLATYLLFHLRVIDEGIADWLLSETREAPAAVKTFLIPLAKALVISVALLAPIMVIARLARRQLWAGVRARVAVTLGSLCVYALSGIAIERGFAPELPLENNLLIYGALLLLRSTPDIPPVDLQPVAQAQVTKIVLLVDESVTYRAYITQLRDNWARWHGVDFGDSVPLGNCSASSNSMLRWGFRASQMLAGKDPRLVPTIWSYAHAAGFQTFFIDGQRNGSYQNYLNGKEAALIDQIIGVEKGYDTDQSIAAVLRSMLLKPGKMFIYINKRGSHFPYDDNYPENLALASGTAEQSYYIAVRYSTQGFLATALQDVPLNNILIIYTSDHGEQFAGGAGHCNTVPTAAEKSVPLLLITGNSQLSQEANDAVSTLQNHAGHEQIFATLLDAMGFERHAAEALYGSSLLSSRVPQRYYHVLSMPVPSKAQPRTIVEFSRNAAQTK